MELISIKTFAVAALILSLTTIAFSARADGSTDVKSLRIGMEKGNPPWSYQAGGAWLGVNANLYRETLAKHKIDIEFVGYDNYLRTLSELKLGKIDAAGKYRSTEVGQQTSSGDGMRCASTPIYHRPWGLFGLSSASLPELTDINQLKNYRVGALYASKKTYTRFMPIDKLTFVRNSPQLARLLQSGRVDLVSSTPLLAEQWRKDYQLETKEVLRLTTITFHLCFSTRSLGVDEATRLADLIDLGLEGSSPRIFDYP